MPKPGAFLRWNSSCIHRREHFQARTLSLIKRYNKGYFLLYRMILFVDVSISPCKSLYDLRNVIRCFAKETAMHVHRYLANTRRCASHSMSYSLRFGAFATKSCTNNHTTFVTRLSVFCIRLFASNNRKLLGGFSLNLLQFFGIHKLRLESKSNIGYFAWTPTYASTLVSVQSLQNY